MSSKYEIEYVGGPMDGHREIRPSQWLMPVLTDCWNHVYYRTPERPQLAVHAGVGQWCPTTGKFEGIKLPHPLTPEHQ